ncbi:hypothetical protein QBC38DRAFT_369900 [Podospora fimiseda]|uniref:Uncharacterized protein n=1 Tax=Podospora fimiseda TaxID=252190 RepID=A0AAN7BKF2_9PEZI|nr:hypothetical protein QBC38DRAFT_369900 [Podospora fimiseda]
MNTAIPTNGINRLAINKITRQPNSPLPLIIPVAANEHEFPLLAAAINTGIQILETIRGRAALTRLGTKMMRNPGQQVFSGHPAQMATYVNFFLQRLRSSFIPVTINDESSVDVIASFQRATGVWNVTNWDPSQGGLLNFNCSRVNAMVVVSKANTAQSRKLADRYRRFQFLFSVATTHELAHAFVAYLSGGRSGTITPPSVSFLDYGFQQGGLNTGESGRWLENQLFGGSIEIYRDPTDDQWQCGLVHVLDNNAVARQVSMATMLTFIGTTRSFHFPLVNPTSPGLTRQDRQARNLRSMGAAHHAASPPVGTAFMQALKSRKLKRYRVLSVYLVAVGTTPSWNINAIPVY